MTLDQVRSAMPYGEEECNLYCNHNADVWRTVRCGSAGRVAHYIAKATLAFGNCAISHNDLAAASFCGRRTVGKAVRELVEKGFISSEGRTATGEPIYKAIWERAEACAARNDFVAPEDSLEPTNAQEAA